MKDDVISRQAAIDALRYAQHRFTVADEAGGMGTVKWSEYVIYFAAAKRVLDDLPPAQPERKTGKWNFIGNQMFECSECGTCYTQSQFYQMRVRISDTEFPKFCPNCGADMREGQDG